jgi:hypothetical protein
MDPVDTSPRHVPPIRSFALIVLVDLKGLSGVTDVRLGSFN